MKGSRNNRNLKPKTENECPPRFQKNQSPQPIKRNVQENALPQLRDLSPFRQLYGSFHFHNPTFVTPQNLSIIETPLQKTPFRPYMDAVEQGFRQISGVITWQKNYSSSEDQASDEEFDSSCESASSSSQTPRSIQDIDEKSAQDESIESNHYRNKIKIPEENESQFEKKKMTSAMDQASTTKRRVFCNCKKTQCLKLYCDCFRENLKCTEGCNCIGCHNLESYEDERNNAMLSLIDRNPLAFIPKIDTGNQHSKGCHCKKSNCQKKYCECFQAGIKCGGNCKCEECKNKGEDEEDHGCTAKKEKKFEEWIQGI